jgi:hypothetical protein
MKRILLATVTAAAILGATGSVRACPMCADAIPEAQDGQSSFDPKRESRGYNDSIYLMLAVPMTLCAAFGLLVYRQVRRIEPGVPPQAQ